MMLDQLRVCVSKLNWTLLEESFHVVAFIIFFTFISLNEVNERRRKNDETLGLEKKKQKLTFLWNHGISKVDQE